MTFPALTVHSRHSSGGSWYFRISSRRMRSKEVRSFRGRLADSNYVRCPSQRLDPTEDCFVGALTGCSMPKDLPFNDLGGVVYARIDYRQTQYPIGSGRVTFQQHQELHERQFLLPSTNQTQSKKVQVDLTWRTHSASACSNKDLICRDLTCFKYFCHLLQGSCSTPSELMRHHKPLMRNSRLWPGPALERSSTRAF